LADTLEGVITQQLLPRADRKGRVAAVEVLIATPAVKNLIREGKTHQIVSSMQTGARYGMQTMDMALRQLVTRGVITDRELNNG
ncbi:MAG: type IV pili twitching motility protein PilT, partial [Moorella humiferrea]|nr:type IV pili twitching motility protein PilT [Moorella humiferrea]